MISNKIKYIIQHIDRFLTSSSQFLVAQQHTCQQMMEPEPPFITLYFPELWIYLPPNTFIRYRGVVEGEEKVGWILSVNPEQCQLCM